MELKPFACIHCQKTTQSFAPVRIQFFQRQVDETLGLSYEKESKLMDYGVQPVFLCDECVRKKIDQLYLAPVWVPLLVFLFAAFLQFMGIYNNQPDTTRIVGPLIAVYSVVRLMKWRASLQHKSEYRPIGYVDGPNMDHSGFIVFCTIASIVIGIASVFMLKVALFVYSIVLLCVLGAVCLSLLVLMLYGFASRNTISEETRRKAIKKYCMEQWEIRLVD